MAIITDLERLRIKSHKFEFNSYTDLQNLIQCLERELRNCPMKGVGLSAIQINLPLRVAIIRTDNLSLDLYNTKIIDGSDMLIVKGEGCLSIPNKFVNTRRMKKITIKNGDGRIYKLEGLESIVAQHEIDHFNGVLIMDRQINERGI